MIHDSNNLVSIYLPIREEAGSLDLERPRLTLNTRCLGCIPKKCLELTKIVAKALLSPRQHVQSVIPPIGCPELLIVHFEPHGVSSLSNYFRSNFALRKKFTSFQLSKRNS